MPTERFYRLTEEKRQKIREAALDEFTRVEVERVSINQIIKKAGISRGSFYTYFESKRDILRYLFEEYAEEVYRCGLKSLEESGGDIWKMLEMILECSVAFSREEKQIAFIKNVLEYPEQKELLRTLWSDGSNRPGARKQDMLEKTVYEACAGVTLKKMEMDEFCAFFQIAMFAVGVEVKNFFEGMPYSLVKKRFRAKEAILKQGVSPAGRMCREEAWTAGTANAG